MTTLVSHALDSVSGCPANGVRIDLSAIDGAGVRVRLRGTSTDNADGRTEKPLLGGPDCRVVSSWSFSICRGSGPVHGCLICFGRST